MMPFTTKDVKDVASLVSCKLEEYINNGRRELNFDPSGRPNKARHPMWQYDTFPRLFNHVTCDTARSRKKRNKSLPRPDIPIDPVIMVDSLKAVQPTEAACIVAYANEIFKSHQIDRLQEVLAYKPSLTQADPKPGHETPQNYTCHVGSCLKSDNYVNYYDTYGLRGGKCRLQPVSKPEQEVEMTQQHSNYAKISQTDDCHTQTGEVVKKSDKDQTKSTNNSRYEACRTPFIGLLLDDTKAKGQNADKTHFKTRTNNPQQNHEITKESTNPKKLADGVNSAVLIDLNTDDEKDKTDDQKQTYDVAYFEDVFKS